MGWVKVAYDHDSRDLSTVWMCLSNARRPPESGWQAAYRDTLPNGTKVIQVRGEPIQRVWVSNNNNTWSKPTL